MTKQPLKPKWKPTHRHFKTNPVTKEVTVGKDYEMLGEVFDASNDLQSYRLRLTGKEYHDVAMKAQKILYRDEAGQMFVREKAEFEDGRFKPLSELEK